MIRIFFALLLGIALISCGSADNDSSAHVKAEEYGAFWLWAGVEPQPVLDNADTIYLMAGEIRAEKTPRMRWLRATPKIDHANVWFVLRVETLDWSPENFAEIMHQLESWASNSQTVGLQIDFDAETQQLAGYAEFLREIRTRLPSKFQLGITGLLDWSANGDPRHLASLRGVIDEAVFQTYQGRETIAGYQQWLGKLDTLPMRFKIGLVQGGIWKEPPSLASNPNFQGYVIFLLNPKGADSS